MSNTTDVTTEFQCGVMGPDSKFPGIQYVAFVQHRDYVEAEWPGPTPCGSLQMMITNATARDRFELGATYRVTFEKVAR